MERGDSIVYHHCEGDLPAEYLGRFGHRHLILIPAHGGTAGQGLRYAEDVDFRPTSIPTASNP